MREISRKAPPVIEVSGVRASGSAEKHGDDVEDPGRIIRQGMLVILLFFGGLGLWAVFGEITGAVVAPGKIKIESERKTVQHLEGGIVDAILVREGEEVREGQPLIILESVQVDASASMLRKQLVTQSAAQLRAEAEKELRAELTWPEDLRVMAEQAHCGDVLEKDQIRAETRIIGTLQEELRAKRQLFEERYIEKSQILELERTLAGHEGSRGSMRQSVAEARQRSAELRLRIEDARNRFVEQATAEVNALQNEILQTRERIRPLEDARKRLQIVAPVAGRVVDLKVHSRGGVVRPGEALMDIVPEDNPLIVEIQVPVNKITEVHIGQEALVQLDAFDTRLVPHLSARVTYISADRLEERTNMGAMPYYLCYVEIDPESLKKEQVYLSPGMPATVFITTKKRSVLFYMLEPLLKSWDRALRE